MLLYGIRTRYTYRRCEFESRFRQYVFVLVKNSVRAHDIFLIMYILYGLVSFVNVKNESLCAALFTS